MADTSFDLIVVGSGPGGYTTAIRGAQLGMKTAIIEREHLGGICLNWGCIPTKALLRSAEIYSNIKHAEAFGFTVEGKVSIDTKKVVERSRKVAAQLSSGVKHLMKKNKITVFDGTAKLAGVNIFVGSAGGPNAPQYGSVFGSLRLSDYRVWVDSIMPREVWPTMLHPTRGVLVAGNMASLNSSDDNRLIYRPGIVFSSVQAPVEYDTMATSPTLNPTKIVFAIESSATSPNIHRTVQLYNYDTLQFETMSTVPSTTTDSVTEYTITSNPGRFVHSNGEVWARISAKAQGPVFAYPWQFAVDRAVWNIQMP